MSGAVYIGCAGWAIRGEHKNLFAAQGSHLERYALSFNAVEINSSFYRPHRQTTYARWKATVPADFRFAVKTPREATHVRRLRDTDSVMGRFLEEISGLGEKLAVILVQLPPSLVYHPPQADRFFGFLRERCACRLALEARHESWFTPSALAWRAELGLGGVGADPALFPGAASATGAHLHYYRWHGSPEIYYSPYPRASLDELAERVQNEANAGFDVWTIFDNTALGYATTDALYVQGLLESGAPCQPKLAFPGASR